MNALFGLCWGLSDDLETLIWYSVSKIRVPPELRVLGALKEPTEGGAGDLPPPARWKPITHKFLDLTQHPYTACYSNN